MIRQYLHDGWQLTTTTSEVPDNVRGRTVPAAVPGSTHLDLLASGLITDPFLDQAETELTWMHRADWRYTTTFLASAVTPHQRVDLVFDGLDTVASIELNGQLVGHTANMHRGYRFDVREFLVDGGNDLAVSFSSALAHAEKTEAALGSRAHVNSHPFNMIRKMACSFGWDWGPDLQTAGIWRPVRLERWHTARLARVRPVVTVDRAGTGHVELHTDIEWACAEENLTLQITVGTHERTVVVPAGQQTVIARLDVPDAELWWPTGYGAQPLYELEVVLRGQSDALDRTTRRIGFRTITVDTTPDEFGTPFTVVVNDRPVYVKGANWIPDDHFLTRITRERLARRVDQAVAAHVNLLRVWGGGIYESDDFYDVCDERGVLVWQDFPLSCAAYAEEEPLRGELEAEARENVVRLMPHASLALWNGGNENMWGHADWGWPWQLNGRTWGLGYYTEMLPRIVAELDPTRFYCPSSPYSPGEQHPNDENHGTRHDWRVWNEVDYTHYRDHVPRFCSEFGFQGPPTRATLSRWIHDQPLTPSSPSFLTHQKAEDGNGKLDRGLAAHLPVPRNFPDWHWATQLNQARAVSFGIEHFRSWWPRTAGAIMWQLNDCWPVTSWAAIDSEERVKPLWYGLRHAFAPRILTFQPRGDRIVLVAVNDHDEPWDAHITLDRQTFRGVTLHLTRLRRTVPPRSVMELDLDEPLLQPVHDDAEVTVATTADARAVLPFRPDAELAYHPRPLVAAAEAVPGGYEVEVTAESFAHDVAILADLVAPDAFVDDMLVPMLAGETRVFHVRTAAVVDPAAFTDRLVLRCANDLSEAS